MGDVPFGARVPGDAQRVRVEALGEPGQRRFRLLAVVESETYIVWMEKQQLDALGQALVQVLDQLPDAGPDLTPSSEPVEFDLATRRQFRAGRMELGYDEGNNRLVIIAHDLETEFATEPSLLCRLTRTQARELSVDAATVVSAGRPRCVLCGQPMGPEGHACPQQNGHLPAELGVPFDDEENS